MNFRSIFTTNIANKQQHLGGTIRLELNRDGHNGNAIYAEMPNDRFKALALHKGDRVALRIKHAHWFN